MVQWLTLLFQCRSTGFIPGWELRFHMPRVQKTNKKPLYHIASYNKRQHVPIPLNHSNTDISFPLHRNSFFRLPLKREARIIVQLQPRHRLTPRNTKGPPAELRSLKSCPTSSQGSLYLRGGGGSFRLCVFLFQDLSRRLSPKQDEHEGSYELFPLTHTCEEAHDPCHLRMEPVTT